MWTNVTLDCLTISYWCMQVIVRSCVCACVCVYKSSVTKYGNKVGNECDTYIRTVPSYQSVVKIYTNIVDMRSLILYWDFVIEYRVLYIAHSRRHLICRRCYTFSLSLSFFLFQWVCSVLMCAKCWFNCAQTCVTLYKNYMHQMVIRFELINKSALQMATDFSSPSSLSASICFILPKATRNEENTQKNRRQLSH